MSRIVRTSEDQQVTLDDIANIARDPRNAHDALVSTAIESAASYSGGSVTKVGATKVSVSTPLHLYQGGAAYLRDGTAVEIDLLSVLPSSGDKRIVAIVTRGVEVEDEIEPRDYLINVASEEVEARPTATRIWRRAEIATVAGASGPDPARPIVDAAYLVLAWVTLSPTQVETVEQVTETRITPLNAAVGRLIAVELWRTLTQPLIDGIRQEIARLTRLIGAGNDQRLIRYAMEQIARLNEQAGLDQEASYSDTDFFLDTSASQLDDVTYLAKVEEGVRFDDANRDDAALALFNSADTRIVQHPSGLILPVYTETPIISVIGKDSEIAISNAGSQTIDITKRTVARTRIRYGQPFTRCTNSQWWRTGRYDVVKGIFERDGETFAVIPADQYGLSTKQVRLRQIFVDTYDEIYWDRKVITNAYTGNIAAETFLMPRSGWLTGINLGFSRKDSAGDVRVIVCRTTTIGTPDPKTVLAEVLVPVANLKVFPELTAVAIPPVLLKGGERYSLILVTPGNHWLALVHDNKYANGSYFTSTDGAWFQGDISRDVCFEIKLAQFAAPRLVVELDDWNLDGGLAGIDLSLEQIVPESCDLGFEIRVGSTWHPVAEVQAGNSPLFGLPASVDARMVLVGTTDLMPGIHLTTSRIVKTRPRTSFVHISTTRTAPANVNEVEIKALLENYVEANHDLTAQLLTGASFDTPVSPTATVDEILPDGSIKRTFRFVGLTPTPTWRRKLTGTTVSALDVFHVAEVTDIGFPAP